MTFQLHPIGPEPTGATPLEAEDLVGLIPDFVATRADLNLVEFESITQALPWARRKARQHGPIGLLSVNFLFELHRHMFGAVWTWAGTQRQRVTNIGLSPHLIIDQARSALDDVQYWHLHDIYPVDERAVRLHLRLVAIHPFRNGNGRCTRLLSDLYLTASGESPFTWGSANLDATGRVRGSYLDAIHAAEAGNIEALVAFARS
jgi:Fic-DOC domain mobile mystery protein B